MLDYKKILFPVDLSETSAKIIPHVKTIADKFGAEIRLMFVAKVHEYYVEDEEPGVGIKKKVKEYRDEYLKDIPDSDVVVADGEAADEILSYIDAEGIDVVISETSQELVSGMTVDYVEIEPDIYQFIFLNPNDANYSPPA